MAKLGCLELHNIAVHIIITVLFDEVTVLFDGVVCIVNIPGFFPNIKLVILCSIPNINVSRDPKSKSSSF